MFSLLIIAVLAFAAVVSLSTIADSARKGFAAARLIAHQLAALDAPVPATPRTRSIRTAAPRRMARRAPAGLRAAA